MRTYLIHEIHWEGLDRWHTVRARGERYALNNYTRFPQSRKVRPDDLANVTVTEITGEVRLLC